MHRLRLTVKRAHCVSFLDLAYGISIIETARRTEANPNRFRRNSVLSVAVMAYKRKVCLVAQYPYY